MLAPEVREILRRQMSDWLNCLGTDIAVDHKIFNPLRGLSLDGTLNRLRPPCGMARSVVWLSAPCWDGILTYVA